MLNDGFRYLAQELAHLLQQKSSPDGYGTSKLFGDEEKVGHEASQGPVETIGQRKGA